MKARRKIGIDINAAAMEYSSSRGLEVYSNMSHVPAGLVDAVISNHALEHVENPFEIMSHIARVLKPGGVAIIVVPCDRANVSFVKNDRDFHLHSWSAGNLGNLASAAGLTVVESHELLHRWPPKWPLIRKVFGPVVFDWCCKLYGMLRRDRSQVRLVAKQSRD